jgi:hypothetical protein
MEYIFLHPSHLHGYFSFLGIKVFIPFGMKGIMVIYRRAPVKQIEDGDLGEGGQAVPPSGS